MNKLAVFAAVVGLIVLNIGCDPRTAQNKDATETKSFRVKTDSNKPEAAVDADQSKPDELKKIDADLLIDQEIDDEADGVK